MVIGGEVHQVVCMQSVGRAPGGVKLSQRDAVDDEVGTFARHRTGDLLQPCRLRVPVADARERSEQNNRDKCSDAISHPYTNESMSMPFARNTNSASALTAPRPPGLGAVQCAAACAALQPSATVAANPAARIAGRSGRSSPMN